MIKNNFFENISKQFGIDIKKGKSFPIGTVRNGRKKVEEGKWVPVKKNTSPKKIEEPKNKGKQLQQNNNSHGVNNQDISKLSNIKQLINDKRYVEALEQANNLSDEVKNHIPKEVWDEMNKLGQQSDYQNEISRFDGADKMYYITDDLFDDYNANLTFKQYDNDLKKLSKEELSALDDYRDTAYVGINRYLRQQSEIKDKFSKAVTDSLIKDIDSSFNKMELKQDMILHRRVDIRDRNIKAIFTSLDIGDTFKDSGYVSTTMSKQALGKFKESNHFDIKILASRGSKSIPMQNVGNATTKSEYSDEFEFLLPRDSEFTVVEKNDQNIIVILE